MKLSMKANMKENMKTINKDTKSKPCLMLTIISVLMTSSVIAEPANVKLAKKEILLDNAEVEVVRATYPVGSESGFHTHHYANRVVYFVKGGKLALFSKETTKETAKGKSKPKPPTVINVADGKTLYLPAITHNVKNIGSTEVIIVETEIK